MNFVTIKSDNGTELINLDNVANISQSNSNIYISFSGSENHYAVYPSKMPIETLRIKLNSGSVIDLRSKKDA